MLPPHSRLAHHYSWRNFQEEIRFLICPEMIVSCLLCEKMAPDEAILIIGAERYSDYEGYAETFRWKYRTRDGNVPR